MLLFKCSENFFTGCSSFSDLNNAGETNCLFTGSLKFVLSTPTIICIINFTNTFISTVNYIDSVLWRLQPLSLDGKEPGLLNVETYIFSDTQAFNLLFSLVLNG